MTQITLRLPESAPLDPSHPIWRDLAPSDHVGVYGTALEGAARARNERWFEWAVDQFGGVDVELAAGNEHWDVGGIAPYLHRYRQLVEADPHIVGGIVYDEPLFGLSTPGYRWGRMTPIEAARATWPMTEAIQGDGRKVYLGEAWPVRSWDGQDLPIKPYLEEQLRLGWTPTRFTLDVNWWHVVQHRARTQDLLDCREWCRVHDIEFGVVIGSPYFGTGSPSERQWFGSATEHILRFERAGLMLRDLDHVIVQAWEDAATIDVMHELLGDVREDIGRPRHEPGPEPVEPKPEPTPEPITVRPDVPEELRGSWAEGSYEAMKETVSDWLDIKDAERPRMNYHQWWHRFALEELLRQWDYKKVAGRENANSRWNRIVWASLVYYVELTKSDLGGLRHGVANRIYNRVIQGKTREEVQALIRGRPAVEPAPVPSPRSSGLNADPFRLGGSVMMQTSKVWGLWGRWASQLSEADLAEFAAHPFQQDRRVWWLTLRTTRRDSMRARPWDALREVQQTQDRLAYISETLGILPVMECVQLEAAMSDFRGDPDAIADYVEDVGEHVLRPVARQLREGKGWPVVFPVREIHYLRTFGTGDTRVRNFAKITRAAQRGAGADWVGCHGHAARVNRPGHPTHNGWEPYIPSVGTTAGVERHALWMVTLPFEMSVRQSFMGPDDDHNPKNYRDWPDWLNYWIANRLGLNVIEAAVLLEKHGAKIPEFQAWARGHSPERAYGEGQYLLDRCRRLSADWSGGARR